MSNAPTPRHPGAVQRWWLYHADSGLFTGASVAGGPDARDGMVAAAGPGYLAYEGDVGYPCSRVDTASGALVPYRPDPPAYRIDLDLYRWRWDDPSKRWVAAPRLAKLKLDQWDALKRSRAAALDAPLETPWGTLDHDAASRATIARKAQAASVLGKPVTFTRADNTVVVLGPSDMVAVWGLSEEWERLVRAVAESLRTALDGCTTPESVFQVVWPM